jgi:hypothetical protein
VAAEREPHPPRSSLDEPDTWCASARREEKTRELPVLDILKFLNPPGHGPGHGPGPKHDYEKSCSDSWGKGRGHKSKGKHDRKDDKKGRGGH